MISFGNIYSKYYNLLYKDKDYKAEVQYIESLIKKFTPTKSKSLLDIGCGTGSHLLHFEKLGYDVFGVDLSEGMIQEAKQKLQKADNLYCASSSNFEIDCKFDIIVSLFHVMSYQTKNSDIQETFENVAKHLKPNGIFIFDFWYGPACLTDRPTVRIKRLEDNDVKITRLTEPVMHANTNIIDVNFEVQVQDKKTLAIDTIHETHNMRYFFLPELEMYAQNAGLKVLRSLEWMTMNNMSFDSWYGVMVVEK